jgi:hypothetical protein
MANLQEVEVIVARRGAQGDAGQAVRHAEAEKRLDKWLIK